MVQHRQEGWGKLKDGRAVELISFRNDHGIEVQCSTLGGIITALRTPDREGRLADIVLGFDTLAEYEDNPPYFGCLVGRCANRLAEGRFSLDGQHYQLAQNDGEHHLHGGPGGFHKVLWGVELIPEGVKLSYESPDGEENYPGKLSVTVAYTLEDSALSIHYQARCDQATIVNLTNHSYFNLSGAADILDHELQLHAEAYTPIDAGLIPTGELRPVEKTPFDFRRFKAIGLEIDADDEQLRLAGGYDHNFVLSGQKVAGQGELKAAASLRHLGSGRALELATTHPGLQFYSGNMMGAMQGKAGKGYQRRAGLCLETQHYPDAMHHQHFPTIILRPGEVYDHRSVFTFSTC